MDPITRASRAFLGEAAAFWRAGKGPVLPMIAAASARRDLVKTLRIGELALENRRPLFLYEAPFLAVRAWGDGLAGAIAEDYEAVRGGAEEEGVTLPPFPPAGEGPSEKDPPLARAVWAMERAAALLAERLDGVLVALLPAAVEDARAYRDALSTLAATRFSRRVRLAVHHPPGGPLDGVLGADGAHFHVDQDELVEYLKQLGAGGGSEGPPGPPPPDPTEEQRLAHEATIGRQVPSPEEGRMLRALLLDAARATGRRDHEGAATRYRAARGLCQRAELALEEAMVLLALGGACLAAGTVDLAVEAYRQAGEISGGIEAWPVSCQALLGAGGAQLTARRYEAAALAYSAAAGAAKRADLAVLGIEALRMAGTCHVLRGVPQEAMRAWLQAVDLGSGLPVAEREVSTFPHVAEDLATMLERRGLHAQAEHVRLLVTAEAAPPPDEPEQGTQTLDAPLRAMQTDAPVLPFAAARGAPSPVAAPVSDPDDILDDDRLTLPAAPAPQPEPGDDASVTTVVGMLSPVRPALPFAQPEPGDDASVTTVVGVLLPLRPALPFEAEGAATDKPRRS